MIIAKKTIINKNIVQLIMFYGKGQKHCYNNILIMFYYNIANFFWYNNITSATNLTIDSTQPDTKNFS